MTTSDRLAASLIGQSLGDALGWVVEAAPAEEAQHYVKEFLRAGRAGERGRGDLPFGQYTDDSQLARELVHSILEAGDFDPSHYAARIAARPAAQRQRVARAFEVSLECREPVAATHVIGMVNQGGQVHGGPP